LEPLVTPLATPLADAMAREGLRRVGEALQRAVADGRDGAARRDMALASLCGGLALANAKLGAVHGFAAPLGGMFPVPHGVACAQARRASSMQGNPIALTDVELTDILHEAVGAG